jgi:hypothetical protein
VRSGRARNRQTLRTVRRRGDIKGSADCEKQQIFKVVAMGTTDAGDSFGVRIDVRALQPLRVFHVQELA